MPEIIDPVFAKTSQNARFLLSENERFGLVLVSSIADLSLVNYVAACFSVIKFDLLLPAALLTG